MREYVKYYHKLSGYLHERIVIERASGNNAFHCIVSECNEYLEEANNKFILIKPLPLCFQLDRNW